ncbi:MAG: SpoIID/LytB domain-containing protein [Halanaerobiales bacterium]|nr:SpoIID/LytB domain-containing protein [Halanaerobiales bacterium]
MNKKFTVIIILVLCFFIGFSIPYIYENYGPLLGDYVNGDESSQVEKSSKEENNNKEKVNKEEIDVKVDYNAILKEAVDNFYAGNYEKSMDKYIELYEKGYNKLEVSKNVIVLSDYLDANEEKIKSILSKTYNEYQNSPEFNYYYGKYLYENNNRQKAEEIFNNLLTLIKDSEKGLSARKTALVHYYLGNILLVQENQKSALNYYNEGIKYNEQIILNYLGAAKIYRNNKDYDKAIEMYKKALRQDHSLSELYYDLAILYDKNNAPLKAYDYWERSLNSGIKVDTARKRIKEIENNYPQYFEEKPATKEKKEIDWFKIVKIEPNKKYNEIKIGLQENLNRIRFQSKNDFYIKQNNKILFEGEKNTQYQINFNNNTFYVLKNGKILEYLSTNQKIKITEENNNNLFAIYDIKYAQNYFWGGKENRQYRGDIYLNPASNKRFNLLNYIDLTSYMLSVVPSEMPASWPSEALKAQSVVARSYILNNLNSHNDKEYDLCASVHCIVYAGASNENKNTTEAIIATKNEVITYKDRIIDAVFSSNSGGYTEASENVWINSLPYLKAVNTSKQNNYEFPLAPYQIEEWFIEKPESYSNNKYTTQSSYRWIKNINLEKLKQRHNLKGIKRVYVTERTTTGTVREIVIEGFNESITVTNSSIRRALTGLKSNKFTLKNIYNEKGLESLIIFGAGWGHSVGMDQSAAAGMAEDGKDYKTIINLFYPDTKITKLE